MSAVHNGKRLRYTAPVIAVIAALAAATGSAQAAPQPSVVVRFADLNLNTVAGAEVLYGRLEAAAKQVCPDVSFEQLGRHLAALRCRTIVVSKAVSSIRSPQLAAVSAAHGRHGTPGAV